MADSSDDAPAPPAVHRRPPRPARGAAAAQGFAAKLRRRLSSSAAAAARASFAADSGYESGPGEPSASSRRRDNSGDASSAGGGGRGGAADFSAFTFRAAAPVHRKAKESPLSSDAIFKQLLSDGTLRRRAPRPLSEKMRPDESPAPPSGSSAAPARAWRSGCPRPTRDSRARYVLHAVDAEVVDGVPEDGEFETEETGEDEGDASDGAITVKRHYWDWVDDDDNDSERKEVSAAGARAH